MQQIIDRVFKSWRTSSVGIAGSAVGAYLFTALGCRWPEPQEWVLVIAPAVYGILVKDQGVSK